MLPRQTANRARRPRAALVVVAVLIAFAAGTVVYASASGPPFSLAAAPATQTIDLGDPAIYTVAIAPQSGFSAAVTLTAKNLPKNMLPVWSVSGKLTAGATVTVPAGSGTRTATLTLAGAAPAGSYTVTVSGAATGGSNSTTLQLVVKSPSSPDFLLLVAPPSTVTAGQSTSTLVLIAREKWAGNVTLGPVTGLPSGATATVTPSSTPGILATLTIKTQTSTPGGTYTPVLQGSAVLSGKTTSLNYASFTLNVQGGQAQSFPIAGNLSSPLMPGVGGTQALNLSITNPYSTALTVSNIQVALSSVTQTPAGSAAGSCNQTGSQSPNFQINNLPSTYSVQVPPGATQPLSALGSGQEPSVTWLDQNWAQNGCLGATLHFTYSGNGQY